MREELKQHPLYSRLMETVQTQGYDVGLLLLRQMQPQLRLKDLHQTLQEAILYEETVKGFFSYLLKGVKGIFNKARNAASNASSMLNLLSKIKRDLPSLEKKAEKIARENNIQVSKRDMQEFTRRLMSDIKPSTNISAQLEKELRLKINESQATFAPEGTWSVSYWVMTWMLMYGVYYLITGVGTITNPVYIPFLVVMLKDLFETLSNKKKAIE